MKKISAVIITLNEERNIERCLLSLQNIVDEIVVVDSGSTDKTKEICEKMGVVLVNQKWLGYGAQKNMGNQQAQNNWILSLDADEALSQELQKTILKLKTNTLLSDKIYEINRLTNYCGKWIKHCGWYPDAKLRLFDKTVAHWSLAQVHEEIEFLETCSIERLKGVLLHYSYYSLSEHLVQINTFTDLAAQMAFQKKKKAPAVVCIILRAQWKFLRDYIFKLGFLDGYAGFLVCKYSALATFTKYTKLKQLYGKNKEIIGKIF